MENVRRILLDEEQADYWFGLLDLMDELNELVDMGMLEHDTNGGYKVTPRGHTAVAVAEKSA